ncbi:DUF5067 domain-containing protein [Streptococcus alactolyticus]|uniref:DUF5067 domain-containing protein n=1 Tax=Streptococcus alactolyticus TaxID=29389 RepID=A0ABY7LZL6_STRAY|nr:DUF5067 domain-containing protein [Streptococcus alactolyticus]WBB06856.1 DUF5067 domain-containing protein [Streptococcus alactolyticus]GLB80357.1 hypothetical protein SalAn1F4_12900 [Streptococcus alactolyticus]
MKKISLFGVTLLSVAVLGACSSNSSSDSSSSSSSSSTTTEQTTSGSSVESTEQTTTYPSSAYVSYPYTIDVPSGNSYVIKNITKTTGSLDGSPIITIEMSFTNNGDTPTSPYMGFVVDWDVQQTDGTTTESLNGANTQMANVDNQDLVNMGNTNVNAGATVDAIIGYTLASDTEDVGFILRSTSLTSNPQGFAWANNQ